MCQSTNPRVLSSRKTGLAGLLDSRSYMFLHCFFQDYRCTGWIDGLIGLDIPSFESCTTMDVKTVYSNVGNTSLAILCDLFGVVTISDP